MIVWLDVETTGLDPAKGELLEVGFIVTDDELVPLDRTNIVLHEPCADMADEVRAMHEASGLLAECRQGCDLDLAEVKLIEWIDRHTTALEDPPILAGNTIGFDRSWLKAKMPRLNAAFFYRTIDVSSIKELNQRWGFAPKWGGDRKIHRALPDLEDSIAELQWYRDHLGV